MNNKFRNAWAGIYDGLHHKSVIIQVVLGLMAIIAGIIMKLSSNEWCLVVICIGCVIGTEMINTCIELICDMYSKEIRNDIKVIKDMAAASVLIASLMSLIVAIIILIEHI